MRRSTPSTACRSCGVARICSRCCRSARRRSPTRSSIRPSADRRIRPTRSRSCSATDCALVQLGYALPADRIFDDDYPYFSSFSDAFSRHAAAHVERLIVDRGLGAGLVRRRGRQQRRLPAAQLRRRRRPGARHRSGARSGRRRRERSACRRSSASSVSTRPSAIRAEHGPADVIVANNVMAHVPDLNDFVGGFAALLADDGLLTVENPYVRDMVDHVEFDTIYHEHYCYFSCSSVDALMSRHGLHLNDVEYFPDLHGGTLRWHVGTAAAPIGAVSAHARRRGGGGHDRLRLLRPVRRACAECQDGAAGAARRAP